MPSYTYNTKYGIFCKDNGFFFFNMHTKYYLNQINSLFKKKKKTAKWNKDIKPTYESPS